MCHSAFDTCFKDRRSKSFLQNLGNLNWVWQPSNGCHVRKVADRSCCANALLRMLISELAYTWGCVRRHPYVTYVHDWLPPQFSPVAHPVQWREWSTLMEKTAGPMLWAGDTHLTEIFLAFQTLTGGAAHSDYFRADSLVNTYTLSPMTPAQLSACESTGSSGAPHVTLPTQR